MPLLTDAHARLSGPLLRSMDHDRQLGHAHVMSSLPPGLGPQPRRSAGVLWHVDQAAEVLIVRYPRLPSGATNLGVITEVREVLNRGHLRIEVAMNIQKTPPTRIPPGVQAELRAANEAAGRGKAFRSRLVIVPEDERPVWIIKRLLRTAGFAVDPASLTISRTYTANLGPRRGGAIPYVEVTATGVPVEQEKFDAALAQGIGKGKNFGLGLIKTFPLTSA